MNEQLIHFQNMKLSDSAAWSTKANSKIMMLFPYALHFAMVL